MSFVSVLADKVGAIPTAGTDDVTGLTELAMEGGAW